MAKSRRPVAAAPSASDTDVVINGGRGPRRVLRGDPLPPGDDVGAAELARRVATNLRDRRKSRGLSLDQLAAASGVSRAALSQIETLKSNPSLSVLWKIAVGLGIPFSGAAGRRRARRSTCCGGPTARCCARPTGAWRAARSPRRASPARSRCTSCAWPARSSHAAEAHAPGTKELIVVLAGLLRMHVGNDRYELGPGDSLAFPADRPHVYENPGGGEARYHNVVVYVR